jgi:DNA polymerase
VVHAAATVPGLSAHTLDWAGLQNAVSACQACGLCKSRQHTVFGTGSAPARWLIVGEAPGEQEDLQGQPFVGPAGQLLDNMLKAVGLSRGGDVFITNVLKCRPPANRNPQPDEMAQCAPFLQRQIELVQPTVILALGRFAAQSLLQSSLPDVAATPLGKLRGQVHSYENNSKHVPVVVSYHPAYLLRAPADKAKAWADWCLALATAPHLSSQTSP